MAQDRVILPASARLKFSHPLIEKPLYIVTGANSIKWSYELNTRVQQTYGGEVVQILSAFVGPITIEGQTRSASQLRDIYSWFRAYMTLAGLGKRSEVPMLFEYPERGWSFHIQPTRVPGFRYATEELGTAYQVQAEIVTNREWNLLSKMTMSNMTESLTKEYLTRVGFDSKSPLIDPTSPANKNGGINDFGENFQRLTAAWATGDFAHWGFEAMRDPGQQFSKTTEDFYTAFFGSNYISGSTSESASGAAALSIGSVDANPSKLSIVAATVEAWEAKGMPGRLGVATIICESGFDPNVRNSIGYIGLFQTQPGSTGKPNTHFHKQMQQAWNATSGAGTWPDISKFYKPSMQISDAADWFAAVKPSGASKTSPTDSIALRDWAMEAQGVNLSNNPRFSHFPSFLQQADDLIKQAKRAGTGNATLSAGTRAEILSKLKSHDNYLTIDAVCCVSTDMVVGSAIDTIVWQAWLAICEAGWTPRATCLKCGHHAGTWHEKGRAVDFDSIDGVKVNGLAQPGLDKVKAFVSWVKANRKALGNPVILGGSGQEQSTAWGTDGPDLYHHVHLQWEA